MGCSCVYIQTGVGEIATFHHITNPIARVEHTCDECGGTINPGDHYERSVGKWGDDFNTFTTCPVCLEVRNAFFCGGYYYGMIWEDLCLHLRELDGTVPDCIADMTPAARDKVCEQIEDIWAYTEEDDS